MASISEHAARAAMGGLPHPNTAPPRTWVLPLLTGTRLTANDRPHWSRRAAVTKEWRRLAGWHAANARIGRLQRAHILIEWLPPDRRRRDPANASVMGKAAVDGIVDAGVLADDSAAYLDGPDYRLGHVGYPSAGTRAAKAWRAGQATLRVTITELPAAVP